MFAAGKKSSDGIYVQLSELIELRAMVSSGQQSSVRPRSIIDGANASKRRGRGMEFAEVRPYQPGDDVRNIDWRVTARTQETYTKLFQEEKERPIYLAVDQRSTMFFGSKLQFKSVLAAKIAGYLAWKTLKNNDNLGGFVFNNSDQQDFRAKRGKRAVLRFLNSLTDFNQKLAPSREPISNSLASIFAELKRITRPGSQIYIISDFHDFDDSCVGDLAAIAKHSEVELIQIYDTLEAQLPKRAVLAISDGSVNAILNTNDKRLLSAFEKYWTHAKQLLAKRATQSRCVFHSISTEKSLKHIIQNTLQGAKVGAKRS